MGRKKGKKGGAISSVLVARLQHGSAEERTDAVQTLCDVMENRGDLEQFCVAVVAAGLIKPLIALVRDGSEKGKVCSLKVLTTLVAENPEDEDGPEIERHIDILAAGCVEELVSLLKHASAKARTKAAEALSILLDSRGAYFNGALRAKLKAKIEGVALNAVSLIAPFTAMLLCDHANVAAGVLQRLAESSVFLFKAVIASVESTVVARLRQAAPCGWSAAMDALASLLEDSEDDLMQRSCR